ncbi:TorF family putative porin [Parahalioglobus pacificus]|uniref:TIGR02001 family outer membrane protein n=1 Tax=Parahalioglobus pacificus TaxID=930806 RepID=A0A918XKT3_9GAMM|nr:TorF family putative porin [Halioglobus pacificus]GHD36430.1 TIGR02001 family outer membrane protein [Halioglobus pacificus]
MLIKKMLPAAMATALLAGGVVNQAQAEVEISGNVALTSDYRFRGISQSNDDIAVQGGFDVAFDNGIYIGTWGSSVDFDLDSSQGLNGSLELDYYVGWASDIGDSGLALDVGYLYYDYPGDSSVLEGDYQEIYASASFADGTVGIHYSDDYYAESGSFFYYYADYSFGLSDTLSLDLHVGLNDFDDADVFLSDGDSYIDYSVGLTASYFAVDWSLAWVGTDLDGDEYFGLDDLVDDTIVFSISKSL